MSSTHPPPSPTHLGVITPRPLSAKGGYKEEHEAAAQAAAEAKRQASFAGAGKRLDGKASVRGSPSGE